MTTTYPYQNEADCVRAIVKQLEMLQCSSSSSSPTPGTQDFQVPVGVSLLARPIMACDVSTLT